MIYPTSWNDVHKIMSAVMGRSVSTPPDKLFVSSTDPKTHKKYQIKGIERMTLNGRRFKLFKAYEKKGDTFVYQGKYRTEAKTADCDLWKSVARPLD